MLDDFDRFEFTHDGATHPVYTAGTGPAVIVIHEAPGITPEVAAFARRLVADGFTVYAPELFGTTERPVSSAYMTQSLARVCASREFNLLATRRASPVTTWLRALSRQIHAEPGGARIGVIGMCMTGNFALALMVDPWVSAPVLSQPSLPLPVSKHHRRALHVSDEDLTVIKRRAIQEGQCVLGLRFTGDRLSPPERFERLNEELGDKFEGIEIDSSPGNPYGHSRIAHSVVTNDLIDADGQPTQAALHRVLRFFHENLDADPSA